ncbi:MAG: regulatory protein RecX [Gammaproteobacteria bacterium]
MWGDDAPAGPGDTSADASDSLQRATARGLRALAGREHTRSELTRKLTRHGVSADQAAIVVEQLAERSLQSDARFVEAFVRARIERGYGPVWIRQALLERGIAAVDAQAALDHPRAFWVGQARRALHKRFGSEPALDGAAADPSAFDRSAFDRTGWARMARFIAQRGFPSDVVASALKPAVDLD